MKESIILDNIAKRLGIAGLNDMQRAVASARAPRIVLLSPTGSGKTVAFAIAMLRRMKAPTGAVQAVVIAPSRELVLQIAEVVRPIATGYKTVALYGGHSMRDEEASLSVTPDIVVATPGRLLDHLNRRQIDLSRVATVVLDEYDKSLELGFADEMKRVVGAMKSLTCEILTSATALGDLPRWLPAMESVTLDFTGGDTGKAPQPTLEVARVTSHVKDKLPVVIDLLHALPDGRSIVFVNHRESAERVARALAGEGLPVGLYHGGLDQNDRENALEMFNNGTTPVLVSTDLASRGLDIADVANVIHYHLPTSPEAWTHRNGRSGRQGTDGKVFVIISEEENIPEWIEWDREYQPGAPSSDPVRSSVATLYINAGKREKISRGDIVGYLVHRGGLEAAEIGHIALRDHSALVAVPAAKVDGLLAALAPHRLKNTRVRVSKLGNVAKKP